MEDRVWQSVLNVILGRDPTTELESLSHYWRSPDANLTRQTELSALVGWFQGTYAHILGMPASNFILASGTPETRHISRNFLRPRVPPTYEYLGLEDNINAHDYVTVDTLRDHIRSGTSRGGNISGERARQGDEEIAKRADSLQKTASVAYGHPIASTTSSSKDDGPALFEAGYTSA